jgi:hypothetical protein
LDSLSSRLRGVCAHPLLFAIIRTKLQDAKFLLRDGAAQQLFRLGTERY